MTTIGSLTVQVNSQGVEQASEDLDKLVASGAKAEQTAGRIGDAWDEARQRMGVSSRESRKALVEQRQALDKLVGQIDPTVAALGRLDKQQQELRKYRAAGILDAESFAEYNSKIEAARTAIGTFSGDLDRTGKTAKETAFAMRGLPAQFTDIFTSLAAGQPAMMVFLQQGGQIKDMFGGIGPAARAMGGYILGLVNPFTVAAAAVGTLVYGYSQGSKEADAFNNALIMTGNAAGTTSSELSGMARRIAEMNGTVGNASAILSKLAASARIPASSFEQIASAAVSMEKAVGRSADQTVAEFARIFDDPLKAAHDLNQQYSFLTASTYEQVVALTEQGKETEAARILADEYADTIEGRSSRVVENLGLFEGAWKAVGDAASGALDAIKEVGRTPSLDAQIERTQKLLEDRKTSLAARLFPESLGPDSQSTKFLEDRLKILIRAREESERQAQSESELAKTRREGEAAYGSIQKTLESTASKQDKLQKALLENERKINEARAAGYTITKEQEALLEKQLRDKFKERTSVVREDAGMARIATLGRENAALLEQLGTTQKLTAGERELAKFTQEIADLRERKVLTAQQKQILASEDEIRAELGKRIELEKQIRLREEGIKLSTYQATLDSQLQQAQAGFDVSLAGVGMGDVARDRMQEMLRIGQEYEQQRRRLQSQLNQGQISQGLYDQETAALESALRERLEMQRDYYQRVDEAQQDWTKGARAAYGNYLESAKDIAGQTKNLFTSAFSSMEDAIVQFAMTGKLSFADFAKSVLADMARIATRQAATGILSSVVGSVASAWAGSAGSGTGATAGDYTGTDYSNWVAGQRASGGPVAPNSLYEVNELGPELLSQGGRTYLMTGQQGGTVVPLGSGMASATASGAAPPMAPQVNITIHNDGTSDVDGDVDMASRIGPQIIALIQTEISKNERRTLSPGGSTWQAINRR
ncbi:phage tail tape measure protein [Stutzerimonas nitrititolerans]|uniref:Phage tail tape measure protein n=1 Tax=Stutzerimonas nitrititolerans TaxID=2482751 RepID=A0AA42BE97_9GAMM|nr:phage tail tape measure protein [Stutzerimonas nitrititolerans]MCO7546176.1 phage tail tape measure protein [Stutzerimonas nitrititolerans]